MNRQKIIFILKSRGYSYRKIGEVMGITKQRTYQIYQDYLVKNAAIIDRTCDICGTVSNSVHTTEDGLKLCWDCQKLLERARKEKYQKGKTKIPILLDQRKIRFAVSNKSSFFSKAHRISLPCISITFLSASLWALRYCFLSSLSFCCNSSLVLIVYLFPQDSRVLWLPYTLSEYTMTVGLLRFTENFFSSLRKRVFSRQRLSLRATAPELVVTLWGGAEARKPPFSFSFKAYLTLMKLGYPRLALN